MFTSGFGVRLRVGGINIEKIEGVRSGEGLCSPQLGVWGLCAKNYAILSKFWYFFIAESGGGLSTQ